MGQVRSGEAFYKMLRFFSGTTTLRVLSGLLIGVGALLLSGAVAYYAYAMYAQSQLAAFEEESQQAGWAHVVAPPQEPPVDSATQAKESSPSQQPAMDVQPLPQPKPGAFRVLIPDIGVDSQIVELATKYDEKGVLVWDTPKHAVGHHKGTANPGETGNVVLSGHISSPISQEGNVFSQLPKLQPGAEVQLQTAQGTYIYKAVGRQVVEPTAVEVMDPTSSPTVTLITCYPDFIYTHRLVVTAKLEEFLPWTSE